MISRRRFLTYLSAAVPVVAIAPSVLVGPKRTIFLPPRGGWVTKTVEDGPFYGWSYDPNAPLYGVDAGHLVEIGGGNDSYYVIDTGEPLPEFFVRTFSNEQWSVPRLVTT